MTALLQQEMVRTLARHDPLYRLTEDDKRLLWQARARVASSSAQLIVVAARLFVGRHPLSRLQNRAMALTCVEVIPKLVVACRYDQVAAFARCVVRVVLRRISACDARRAPTQRGAVWHMRRLIAEAPPMPPQVRRRVAGGRVRRRSRVRRAPDLSVSSMRLSVVTSRPNGRS